MVIAAGLAAIAVLAGAAYATGVIKPGRDVLDIVRHIVYSARTSSASTITFPAVVKSDLEQVGLAHGKVGVTRIEGDGTSSTSIIDLTPRAGNSVSDPPLTVGARALPKIDEKIASIEAMINTPARTGGQALYTGLAHTDFTSVPTVIASTGIDLSDPTDFRRLAWSTPVEEVLAAVRRAAVQPALHGPVTFVTVPTAGDQSQLGQAEKDYRNATWRSLLTSAGATSVTFIDPDTGPTITPAPFAPTVPTLAMPGTPIKPVTLPNDPPSVTCTVPGSYFLANTPRLINEGQTIKDLAGCITEAVRAGAAFHLDGWTSYEGPLTSDGKPAIDRKPNRELSQQRIDTITRLLTTEFSVNPKSITGTAHGNTDQPYPDNPRSERNRNVRITLTTSTAR